MVPTLLFLLMEPLEAAKRLRCRSVCYQFPLDLDFRFYFDCVRLVTCISFLLRDFRYVDL